MSLRPTVVAASRSSAAARLADRRVRDDRILPPEILLPGARQSHEVKCLALGQAVRSVPHSPTSLSARDGPEPVDLGQVDAQDAHAARPGHRTPGRWAALCCTAACGNWPAGCAAGPSAAPGPASMRASHSAILS